MERTLKNLRKSTDGDIYIWLRDSEIGYFFMEDATAEGFTLGGDRPIEHQYEEIMALHDDTISYVGANGRVRFQCGETPDFHRVDYEKYLMNETDYRFCEEEVQ